MPRPSHGAVGLAFLGTRALQVASLVISLSFAAKFVSVMIDNQQTPPPPLIGVLSVVCFAILYCATTLLLYWDRQLPLLPTAAIDGLFFLATMVSAIVIGKPLSYLSCAAVGAAATSPLESLGGSLGPAATATATAALTPAAVTPYFAPATATVYTTTTLANAAATVVATLAPGGTAKVLGSDGNTYTVSKRQYALPQQQAQQEPAYESWLRAGSEGDCVMMKAVWGFGIALTILFVFSAVMVAFIWKAEKQNGTAGSKAAAAEGA
jgi:hypothetical protein